MKRNQPKKESTPKKSNVPEDLEYVIQAFRDFDKNDDGKITNQEFKYILTLILVYFQVINLYIFYILL